MFAHQTNIGQRLFDDDAAVVALDHENEIEIAVTDLADLPAAAISADALPQNGIASET